MSGQGMASATASRFERRFARTRAEGRAALVTFITAGDPDFDTSLALLKALPHAGADIIELGMPFTDPMADGPAIQAASLRALKGGQTMRRTLDMVRAFREQDADTPIVLMGYYNPVYVYGNERFLADAKRAGVDGLIIVDLPPEEDEELCLPALAAGLSFIRLATPTSDEARLGKVLRNTGGFVYYVSIVGVTGTAAPDPRAVSGAISRIKAKTDLPVAVGFGVSTPEQAAVMATSGADAVVVGSALVRTLEKSLDGTGAAQAGSVAVVSDAVRALAEAIAASGASKAGASARAG